MWTPRSGRQRTRRECRRTERTEQPARSRRQGAGYGRYGGPCDLEGDFRRPWSAVVTCRWQQNVCRGQARVEAGCRVEIGAGCRPSGRGVDRQGGTAPLQCFDVYDRGRGPGTSERSGGVCGPSRRLPPCVTATDLAQPGVPGGREATRRAASSRRRGGCARHFGRGRIYRQIRKRARTLSSLPAGQGLWRRLLPLALRGSRTLRS